MSELPLGGCRILVVEDEYMLADFLCTELNEGGAAVLGPAGTVENAINLIKSEQHIDGAILDVNLGGEMAYPVADLLVERAIPFVFTSGYDSSVIPSRFKDVACCEKPVNMIRVTKAIKRLIHT